PDFSVAPSLGWLEPDDSANYSVTFTPSSPGLKNGYIIFTHSADGSPDSLPVSGIGVAPEISIAPLTLDFKSVQLGVSKTENVIVTNTGTSDLGITNVQSDNGDFVILPTGAIIAPSQSDTFAITFTPAALGIVTGEISFTHNASGSPSTVEVSGTGIATAFAVAPGNISFGDVLLGGSKTDSVTAYNLGSANLVISSALADNALFLVAPGNITIPPYDSAQFYVTFSASSYGEQSGNVIFNHNANGTPDSVLLSSRTVAPLFSLSASSLNFQDVVYGSSKTDSVVVTNSGTAELTITGVQSNESDFAVSPASISLLPSESETFLVTFTPSSIGAIEGAGIFVHNAGSSPDTLRLSGTGIYGIVEVPISSRWNLISLPVVPLNDSLRAMFPNSIQPYAYSYDGTTYLQQETMQKGTGYWVKFPAAETASVQGYPFYRDTVTVHAGWNLIGATSQPLAALSVEPLGTELESQLWGFRSGYYNADTLYPGNGYWVKTTQTGSLILNPLSVKQRSSPEISEINVEQFLNKLIIVNGTGEKVMLYYGEPTEGTSQNRTWELPPLPPIGIFDARFVTGTYVELNSETQERVIPLSFSSVQLPLTVRWEIRENKSHHASLRVEGRTIELNNDGEVIITDLTSTVSLVLDKRAIIPQEYALQQNYPNPFNPSTVFSFQFPVSCWVTLKIYNVLGEEMATLIDGMQDAGYRMQSFDASGLPSGVYYYRMTAGSFSETKRMVLMR
ncbi:MAG: choice-of-anchor D domain-containing protein, partial [Bacteroidetes bacterium]